MILDAFIHYSREYILASFSEQNRRVRGCIPASKWFSKEVSNLSGTVLFLLNVPISCTGTRRDLEPEQPQALECGGELMHFYQVYFSYST